MSLRLVELRRDGDLNGGRVKVTLEAEGCDDSCRQRKVAFLFLSSKSRMVRTDGNHGETGRWLALYSRTRVRWRVSGHGPQSLEGETGGCRGDVMASVPKPSTELHGQHCGGLIGRSSSC